MAGVTGVTWLGDRILIKAAEACAAAIDVCTEGAAKDAAMNHWWSDRTGDLARNTINIPATLHGAEVTGKFGSSMRAEGFYGLFLERRTPWLRPAADRNFHKLPVLLRGMLKWT